MLQQLLPIGKYNFYVCGPNTFMQDIYDLLTELGIADKQIRTEAFGPASLIRKQPQLGPLATKTEAESANIAAVEFKNSQIKQTWTEIDGNLLDFAESHGLAPEFGCRGGSCGSCKVKVLEGEVTHQGKTSFEIENDEALLCCAVPAQTEEKIMRLVLEV
jgi:ferredoxin